MINDIIELFVLPDGVSLPDLYGSLIVIAAGLVVVVCGLAINPRASFNRSLIRLWVLWLGIFIVIGGGWFLVGCFEDFDTNDDGLDGVHFAQRAGVR